MQAPTGASDDGRRGSKRRRSLEVFEKHGLLSQSCYALLMQSCSFLCCYVLFRCSPLRSLYGTFRLLLLPWVILLLPSTHQKQPPHLRHLLLCPSSLLPWTPASKLGLLQNLPLLPPHLLHRTAAPQPGPPLHPPAALHLQVATLSPPFLLSKTTAP